MPPAAGRFVTETFDYDGGRLVTAYVPSARPEAVIFAGDGQLITSWGGVLEAAGLPPTMIIGAHRPDDEMLRLHEYSPGRAGRVARRCILGAGVPADGGVGLRTLNGREKVRLKLPSL
jgi:hypothetical protein